MTARRRRPLVVGYGAAMRGDHAIGWYIANLISADTRFAYIDVLAVHQLTPELTADFAAAARVVLLDAAADGDQPGTVHVIDVRPADADAAAFTHRVNTAGVVALTEERFGDAPPTTLVTVSIASTAQGHGLSRSVAASIPQVIEAVADLTLEAAHA
jgi:hydrogenase maturation protease